MSSLATDQIAHLRRVLEGGAVARQAAPAFIGGTVVGNGLWRFFSPTHPGCGADHWNKEWCAAWALPRADIFAFGEDAFGNQLLLTAMEPAVYLCDHENGSCHNLELSLADLLEAVLQHGPSWIDFYSNGALDVAKSFLVDVTWDNHLHWTQPLILGGAVAAGNVAVVDRFAHLSGHAKLWKQLSVTPPGTGIRIQ